MSPENRVTCQVSSAYPTPSRRARGQINPLTEWLKEALGATLNL